MPADQDTINGLLTVTKSMTALGGLLGSAAVSGYFVWKVFVQHLGTGPSSNSDPRFTTALEHLRDTLTADLEQLRAKLPEDLQRHTLEVKGDMQALERRVADRITELAARINNIDTRIDSLLRRNRGA